MKGVQSLSVNFGTSPIQESFLFWSIASTDQMCGQEESISSLKITKEAKNGGEEKNKKLSKL